MKKFEVSYVVAGYTFHFVFNSYEETMNFLRNNKAPVGATDVKVKSVK